MIDDIKDPASVPHNLKSYIRYSTDFYYMIKGELQKKIKQMTAEVDNGRREFSNVKELIIDWETQLERLEEQKNDGLFVDPRHCNQHGVSIDWKSFYNVRNKWLNEEIDSLLILAEQAPTEELKRAALGRIVEAENKLNKGKRNVG